MGGQAGILQGERRWAPLALVYLAAGVPRLVIGTALLLWRPTESGRVIGVGDRRSSRRRSSAGWPLRRPARRRHVPDTYGGHGGCVGAPARPSRNSHALLAFFALSNADVIVARSVLDDHEAGLYAGGLILTKAVLFLPQFVVVVAFPSMSTESARRTALLRSLGRGDGARRRSAPLAAWLLSGVALIVHRGPRVRRDPGPAVALRRSRHPAVVLQLLVYSVVARQCQRSVYLVWAALSLLVICGRRPRAPSTELLNVSRSWTPMLLRRAAGR